MANKSYSLAHTKWMCKYHIVFTTKYIRKAIYVQYRKDLQEYIKTLYKHSGIERRNNKKYIREQDKKEITMDKLSVKEYEDPFKK